MFTLNGTFRLMILSISVLLFCQNVQAQCTKSGKIIRETSIYDRTPRFLTGSGWQVGAIVGRIPAGTQVLVCGQSEIGALFDKKTWYQVRYENTTGWVPGEVIQIVSGLRPTTHVFSFGGIFVSAAYAQNPGLGTEPSLGIPEYTGYMVYLLALVCCIFGMFSKMVWDEIERTEKASLSSIKACLCSIKFIQVVIIAPIVFLAFLKTGDFSSANTFLGLLICAFAAFQNGFFWQTVFKQTSQLEPSKSSRG